MNDKEKSYNIDLYTFKKMCFIYNAVENGWNIQKDKDNYIFKKNHEGDQEIFSESYLSRFMNDNLKQPR